MMQQAHAIMLLTLSTKAVEYIDDITWLNVRNFSSVVKNIS